MGVRDLFVLLWLLSAARNTKQGESLTLSLSPQVMTTCGQRVTLYCNASSSQDGLSVKHMSWKHNNKTLCNVIDDQLTNDSSGMCHYDVQSLSINFLQTMPHAAESQDLDKYICKLRSNQGYRFNQTLVKLKECYRDVEFNMTAEGLTCTITGVYPDGDMHWFHGATRLTESNRTLQIWKHVDKGGYLTIIGRLRVEDHTGPYKCSLWNTESKKYTASKVSTPPIGKIIGKSGGVPVGGPQWSIWGFFMVSVLLMML